MKKSFMLFASALCALVAPLTGVGDVFDYPVGFFTCWDETSTDAYADGMTVYPNEFYAVVWVPKGKTWDGFNERGELVNPTDNELLKMYAAAHAEYRCLAGLQVDFGSKANYETKRDTGSFYIVMLDTRKSDKTGLTTPISASKPSGISGYASAQARVVGTYCVYDAGVVPTMWTMLGPTEVPVPFVTQVAVSNDVSSAWFVISFTNTVSTAQYTAGSVELGVEGVTPVTGATTVKGSASPTTPVEVAVPMTETSGFFKVMVKP